MRPQELKSRLRGVIAFTPTPFTPDDRPDLDGLARQVDYLCTSGAHVVVVCGGVGEYFSLTEDEYRECIRVGVEAGGRRVPILAGIGHSTKIARGLAEYAASVGADGLMINPLYFVEPSEQGRFNHYADLARAAGLGMMIFSTNGSVYSPAMVERLAAIDEVIALKDEYGDLRLFIETRERLGDRLAWINGMAETLAAPYFAAGADAFTSGIVNFAPKLSLAVWEAGANGRWDELHELVATRVRPLARLRAKRPGYLIAVIKEAMNLMGLPGGALRSPLEPVEPADRAELEQELRRQKLLGA
ncbi:MAG: 5-dehydro-4-deoxyglucarate dehydratase [Thermomicrobiales bacterium]|jgi:5-dehydro-4-deoxyglucarate dehydratase|nr:5-dehydro-4-deoxyglucarate dehydratase [Thermomicrobiales bacterium]MEA2585101.1 5-dehydro-4-deoxyglucarate dehydratase [Thermomicrobiales bacterium]MEA2595393.1 5-dehydro-4-deoxyglucarate dehydratase [Thermomicrobiales bacterium]